MKLLYSDYDIIDNDLYNIKIPIIFLRKYINKFKLNFIGTQKEYFLNNVIILSNGIYNKYYRRIYDKINISEHGLEISYEDKEIIPFNFYNCDHSEIYKLYKKDNISLKLYDNYFILEKYI